MNIKDKLFIASKVVCKGYSYGDLKYGDDLYDQEHEADSIWEFVEEIRKIGSDEFVKKYARHFFYPGF